MPPVAGALKEIAVDWLFMAAVFYLLYKSGFFDLVFGLLGIYICWELLVWLFPWLFG
jgi:hypothetical protein